MSDTSLGVIRLRASQRINESAALLLTSEAKTLLMIVTERDGEQIYELGVGTTPLTSIVSAAETLLRSLNN